MKFINNTPIKILNRAHHKYSITKPYPHIIIDNFFKKDFINNIVNDVNSFQNKNANSKFTNPKCPWEYNKFAFEKNFTPLLKQIFMELASPEFISYLEKLTGISNLITNDITLKGAGVHRIANGGYLGLHTDFNTYHHPKYGKLDRRINLLVYLNPDWKPQYNGEFWIVDKENMSVENKISPILNRCVIFNTTNKSIHGHPEKLSTPNNVFRHSIAMYYYTKNQNKNIDFEGDHEHNTIFYDHQNIK